MGIRSWLGEDEPDLEMGGDGEEENKRVRTRGCLEKGVSTETQDTKHKTQIRIKGRLEKGESTETQDTRLSCVDDQPDNPLDVGLFTVTPRKKEDRLFEDGKGDRDDLKRGAQDDPLDLKTPYTLSSRQLEGEGLRVARGESAFLSKSQIMWVNAKVWLAEHVLGYVV